MIHSIGLENIMTHPTSGDDYLHLDHLATLIPEPTTVFLLAVACGLLAIRATFFAA